MIRKHIFLLISMPLIFIAGRSVSADDRPGEPGALVQVAIRAVEDVPAFEATGLPAFALMDGADNTYVLTGGNESHLNALRAAGLDYTVLDPDRKGSEYFFVMPLPGSQEVLAWEVFGSVLLDDGRQLLIRATADRAAALSKLGFQLQRLTFDSKPLTNPTGAEFPEIVDPDPIIQAMVSGISTQTLEDRTGGLSGEWPVIIDGSPYTLSSRNTYSGTPIQKATQYVGEQMAALGLAVEYHQWSGAGYPNVIGELPGQVNPDLVFMIGAHLDNMPSNGTAPGADDNASGSVATLLAAELFSQYQWGCTLRFAFWTGEEQGLLGSHAYAQRAYNTGENIAGYLNLDMIAWNTAGSNPEIELHAKSSLPETMALAQLFSDVVAAYNFNLNPVIVSNGSGASDHASFWSYGFTSILGIEDFSDFNPYYHTSSDDMDNFQDWPYYTEFVKASLATYAHMSGCLISGGVGFLEGTVTAADGGAPLSGADIHIENDSGQTFDVMTDPAGYYTRTLMTGSYTVTATAFGYLPETAAGVAVVTDTITTQDFALQTATNFQVAGTVLEQGTGAPLLAQVSVLDAPVSPVWTDPATGAYVLSVPAGVYSLQATADGHHPALQVVNVNSNTTADFMLEPLACILLVDDDNDNPDVRPYFTAALDTLGLEYDIFNVGGGVGNGPDPDGMLGYRHIIWFSGDKYGDSAGPNAADESALTAYLQSGGNFFLSSQDYLYDFGSTTFNQTYLGVGSYTNDNGDATVKYGVTGDPIGHGHGPYSLLYPSGFSDYGDILNPQGDGSVAFRSGSTGGNDLDLDLDGGDWKTVFFGTSWVPIFNSSPAAGGEVLDQILTWFGGCTSPGLVLEIYIPIMMVGPASAR